MLKYFFYGIVADYINNIILNMNENHPLENYLTKNDQQLSGEIE